jgi:hypothetical protein
MDSRSFQTSVLQATIFTPDMDFSTSKVMSIFYPKCAEYFDADPEVVPNMPGFPPEVPRVILKNKDDTSKLEIAAARVNCFRIMKKYDAPIIDINQFYSDAIRFLSLFKEAVDCRIGRLAALRTIYANHDDPGFFLSRHFCKDIWDEAPLNRPENFELHAHKVFSLSDKFTVNSWARSKTGNLIEDKKKSRIILFEQDLNTLADEAKEKSFNFEDIALFFNQIIPELDNILNQYYPISVGDK